MRFTMYAHYPLDIWYGRSSRELQLDQQVLRKAKPNYDSEPKYHISQVNMIKIIKIYSFKSPNLIKNWTKSLVKLFRIQSFFDIPFGAVILARFPAS